MRYSRSTDLASRSLRTKSRELCAEKAENENEAGDQ